MIQEELIELERLEIVTIDGNKFAKIKGKKVEPIDDSLPDDIKDLIRDNDISRE